MTLTGHHNNALREIQNHFGKHDFFSVRFDLTAKLS